MSWCIFHKNYEAMQFLIESRHRHDDRRLSVALYRPGLASYAVKDEKMAQWLREAQQPREQARAESGQAEQSEGRPGMCYPFHREPSMSGFRTFFLSAVA